MQSTKHSQLVLPPEWHTQKAVILTWAHAQTDWLPYLADIVRTQLELTRIIAEREQVIIVAHDAHTVQSLIAEHIPASLRNNICIVPCPTNDTWARDHAPLTLLETDAQGNTAPVYLDFGFNGWGNKFAAEHDNAINACLQQKGILKGKWQNHKAFVLEGGSIESDGKGTVFTTSLCLLAPQRNQPLTRNEIETQLKAILHAERVVWIDHGQLIGDDTDGHIDTTVRIAPADTLLYVGCDNVADPQYQDFRAMEQQLASLKTLDGLPYRLLKLPMPDAIFDGTDRLPATYANFLIINGAVIMPTYRQPQNDRKAAAVLQMAFPDRTIIPIDACTPIRQHGSLHCLTMQIPATDNTQKLT